MYIYSQCIELATVLEDCFGESHSSSPALGRVAQMLLGNLPSQDWLVKSYNVSGLISLNRLLIIESVCMERFSLVHVCISIDC